MDKPFILFGASIQKAGDLTDENGIIKLRFYANESKYTYKLGISKLGKYETMPENPEVSFSKKGVSTLNFSLTPLGNLTFNIKGNKGAPIITYEFKAFYKGVDTSITILREAKKETKVYFSVYDGVAGGKTSYGNIIKIDSFTTTPPPPPDTVFHLFEF